MNQKAAPVWIQFQKGKVKGQLIKRGEKVSRVRYLESFKFPTYKAAKGDERMVWNLFISARRS